MSRSRCFWLPTKHTFPEVICLFVTRSQAYQVGSLDESSETVHSQYFNRKVEDELGTLLQG